MNLQQQNINQDKTNFDQTKQTFIDKLKNYQTLNSFTKSAQFDKSSRFDNIFSQTTKQKNKLQMQYTSPRFGEALGKRFINSSLSNKNSVEEFKLKLYGKLDTCPDTCYSLIRTKYTTQQKYFDQQFEKQINQLSIINGKYASYQTQHSQFSKQNFLSLDSVQKYLVSAQKIHSEDFSLVSQKSKQIISQTIKKGTQIIKTKHKNHLESCLKAMTLIDQQSQLLKQGLTNESQLSEHDWCQSLDKINDDILVLNSLITETKLEQNDRFMDMQWKLKQMQFGCEQSLQREHKQRIQKQSRLYQVLQRLIQRVGSGM